MEQAATRRSYSDDRTETQDVAAEEVIDAFDHVLEALDQILVLTETAFADSRDARR